MSNAARCNPCNHHDDCGCADNCPNIDRHLIQDPHRAFCTEVRNCEVYQAEQDDVEIVKYGGGEVVLPCPEGLDCPHTVSVVAADADVLVSNTGSDLVQNGSNNNQPIGNGQVTVAAGTTAEFHFVPAADADECNGDGAGSWAPVVSPTPTPQPGNGTPTPVAVRRIGRRR